MSECNTYYCPPGKETKKSEECDFDCGRIDLKLKEAEKTIANKDVIIKMLQNQVKKMEESYKQNVKQTEEFRYKYCLAAEKIQQLQSCTNSQCLEDQQKESTSCNKIQEQQRCKQVVCPDGFYKDECTDMQSHYKMLQMLVDQIVNNKKCTRSTCKKSRANYTENKIIELQEKIDKLITENTKLQKLLEDLQTEKGQISEISIKTPLPTENLLACSILDKKHSIKDHENRRVSFPVREISELSNVSNPQETAVLENTETDSKDKPFEEGSIQSNEDNDIVKDITHLKQSSSLVHAVDSLTVHQRHLSGSKSGITDELADVGDNLIVYPVKDNASITSDSSSKLQKPSVSFHVAPIEIISEEPNYEYEEQKKPDEEQESPVEEEAHTNEEQEHLEEEQEQNQQELPSTSAIVEQVVATHQMLGEGSFLKTADDQTWSRPSTLHDLSDLQEIKINVIQLRDKQDVTQRELVEVKNEIEITRQNMERNNAEISKLREAMETQKNILLDNSQENKKITSEINQLNSDLSQELREVKSKIEMIIKSVKDAKLCQKCTPEEKEADDNHFETNGSNITVEQIQEMKSELLTNEDQIDDVNDVSRKVLMSNYDMTDNLEENYSELKQQKTEKDQQITCLNSLLNYYNKLNQEVSCICPILPQENNNIIDTEDSSGEPKNDKEDESLQCNCLTYSSKGTDSETCNNQSQFEDEKCNELQIEDIYHAVLKCTKKSSSTNTSKSIKSATCSCNINIDKLVKENRRKVSLQDIYEAVRCSCKQRKEQQTEDTKCDCNSSVSSGSGCNPVQTVCQPTLETYLNYLHEQLQVISAIENQIECLNIDVKTPSSCCSKSTH